MTTRLDLQEYLKHSNVQAFLHVIREGETSQTDEAFRTVVGGELFDDFGAHPNKLVRIERLNVSSTAAGAYQFLYRTWEGLRKKYDFLDFSPQSQNEAAVALLVQCGAIQPVLAGDVVAAIKKANRIWASLPDSPYGQGGISYEHAREVWASYGGTLRAANAPAAETVAGDHAGAAPADDAGRVPAKRGGMFMSPFIPIAIQALSAIIPKVRELFGSGSEVAERNFKAAEVLVDVAKSAAGAVNEQELIDKIKTDPTIASTVQKAVQEHWFEIDEAGGGGIDGARKADQAFVASGESVFKSPSFVIAILLIPLVYLVVLSVMLGWGGEWPSDVRASTVTLIVGSIVGGLIGYYFGEKTSKNKQVTG